MEAIPMTAMTAQLQAVWAVGGTVHACFTVRKVKREEWSVCRGPRVRA